MTAKHRSTGKPGVIDIVKIGIAVPGCGGDLLAIAADGEREHLSLAFIDPAEHRTGACIPKRDRPVIRNRHDVIAADEACIVYCRFMANETLLNLADIAGKPPEDRRIIK